MANGTTGVLVRARCSTFPRIKETTPISFASHGHQSPTHHHGYRIVLIGEQISHPHMIGLVSCSSRLRSFQVFPKPDCHFYCSTSHLCLTFWLIFWLPLYLESSSLSTLTLSTLLNRWTLENNLANRLVSLTTSSNLPRLFLQSFMTSALGDPVEQME